MTGKFKRANSAFDEFGRRGVERVFREMEKVTLAMRARGLPILEDNPVFGLLERICRAASNDYVNEKCFRDMETRFQVDELERFWA